MTNDITVWDCESFEKKKKTEISAYTRRKNLRFTLPVLLNCKKCLCKTVICIILRLVS